MKTGSIIKIRSSSWAELNNVIGIVYESGESFVCIYFAQLNRKMHFGTGIFRYIEVIK